MLTNKQMKVIDEYVSDEFYDKDRLVKYLNMHDVVGNEIFAYVDRNSQHKEAHSQWLDDEEGYVPVPVDTFVRRIPLYFYARDGKFGRKGQDIGNIIASKWNEIRTGEILLEEIYKDLEYMFYEKKFPHTISLTI